MNSINRATIIVLDSVGIGALPDAKEFESEGAATLPHLAKEVGGLDLPNLEKLGLGNIVEVEGLSKVDKPKGAIGKMAEQSNGKDTTTGHWELAGLVSQNPFPTYPNGFPDEIMDKFHEAIGKGSLGNKPASGTVIIEELGEEHFETGKPIVYTSADSVFQIAAHEEIIPVEELYKMCRKARKMLTGEHAVARVIARPFVGELGDFTRTARRKDFSLKPPKKTMLDHLKDAGQEVMAVGKIKNIFSGQGITSDLHTDNNMDGVDKTIDYLKEDNSGLIFTNLVDFDQKYGHRRDPEGYAKALKNFDDRLPEIIEQLEADDLLIITADHGCDPTYKGTDHTREYVPLLVYGANVQAGVDLGIRESFSDLAATITSIFKVEETGYGTSFKQEIFE
ncbi:phosphopentomutase [Halobacteroides halobius DSM 5150]|uniref:Phosphopentomutase n=1 Tax=Halobacteroides halobius (strain ATCC 35273 / DSM 5150 / MD-1) TaxID=748449 RepID=L0K7M8_HALHC|nr:phosphopentomutase [Halobacteroides halobius]AGB40555.1 phosphopentomutase [Halobacteroides halobius DSM 5150]